jgi:lysozyme
METIRKIAPRRPGYPVAVRARVAGLFASVWLVASPAAAEPPPCGVKRRLPGIDVSSYQGEIDWKRVKAAGIAFAFARVSDGLEVIDARFEQNYRAMKRAGVRRGAYQYFRASADPDAQADLLVSTVARLGRPDLPLVADVETADGVEPEELRRRLTRWLRRVERRSGRRPLIYTSPSMSDTLAGQFGRYRLWVAHYGVECPTVPAGWRRWSFWQQSDSGRVAGIAGPVDLDAFAGTATQLRRLGRSASSRVAVSASASR